MATCYHLDGSRAGPDTGPCDDSATGANGSHTTCCNVNNQDACLSSGLCWNSLSRQNSHFLWATGCTDPTMQDPSCPSKCLDSGISNARLMFCNDTNFCCLEYDAEMSVEDCCRDSSRFQIQAGTVLRQLGVDTTPTPGLTAATPSCTSGAEVCPPASIPSSAIAGLAVEGGVLALSLAALAFLGWRARRLSHENKSLTQKHIQLEEKNHELEGLSYQYQQQQSGYGATELPQYGYGSPLETSEGRQELSSGTPELLGRPIPETAESSADPSSTTGSPSSPRHDDGRTISSRNS